MKFDNAARAATVFAYLDVFAAAAGYTKTRPTAEIDTVPPRSLILRARERLIIYVKQFITHGI